MKKHGEGYVMIMYTYVECQLRRCDCELVALITGKLWRYNHKALRVPLLTWVNCITGEVVDTS